MGIDLLKTVTDDKIIKIVGGIFTVLNPERVINESGIDAVCVGEGEYALVELCRSIQNGAIDTTIKNIWFKQDDRVIRNPTRTSMNIDEIPFQDWTSWEIPPRSCKPMAGRVRKTALVELSRGCPFRCSFCANSYLNTTLEGHYRERSVDRFADEVDYLRSEH